LTARAPEVKEAALAGLLIGLFVAMELIHPMRPGMAFGGGLLMDQHLAAKLLETFRERSFWDLFVSGELPSQRDAYHSTLMAYLYLPFAAIFGRNWLIAKHWPLFWAVPTVLFSYFFLRALFSRQAALLGLCFLVIHPAYVMGIRIGGSLLSHMQFFSMGTLCFLALWWTSKRPAWFRLAMLLLGLGMSTNLWFYWFVAGLGACALLGFADLRRRFDLSDPSRFLRWMAEGVLFFCLGAALLFYREFFYPGQALAQAFERADHLLAHASPAASYFDSLVLNLRIFRDHLAARSLVESTLSVHPLENSPLFPFANPVFPWVVLASFVFLVSNAGRSVLGKKALVLPVLFVVMTALSALTPRGGTHLHLFFLYPLPLLAVGVAVSAAWTRVKQAKIPRAALAAILLAVMASEAAALGRYLVRFLSVPNGKFYTDTVYDAAGFLRSRRLLSHPFAVFADREEALRHLYFVIPDVDLRVLRVSELHPERAAAAGLTEDMRRWIAEGREPIVFVRHVNDIHPAYMAMIRQQLPAALRIEKVAEFRNALGDPSLEIYLFHPPTDRRDGVSP
jgi:hypothetical protein